MLVDPDRKKKDDDVCAGVVLLIFSHIVAYFLFFFIHPLVFKLLQIKYIPYFALYPIPYWFIIQFIYVIPMCLIFQRKGYKSLNKGIIIGTLVTVFVNGTCFLWMR